jgi:hypothetical protein
MGKPLVGAATIATIASACEPPHCAAVSSSAASPSTAGADA